MTSSQTLEAFYRLVTARTFLSIWGVALVNYKRREFEGLSCREPPTGFCWEPPGSHMIIFRTTSSKESTPRVFADSHPAQLLPSRHVHLHRDLDWTNDQLDLVFSSHPFLKQQSPPCFLQKQYEVKRLAEKKNYFRHEIEKEKGY